MSELLLCTDLDRTLLPNGDSEESSSARPCFERLAARPEITLAYVSGRHRELVQQAMTEWHLPRPRYVIGDVGTTMYRVSDDGSWQHLPAWEDAIAQDWRGHDNTSLAALLDDLPALRLQEKQKQNRCKLSFYVDSGIDEGLLYEIRSRLDASGARCNLVHSIDDANGVGLLDVLPASASKLHAVQALMQISGHAIDDTVFCGDSGNDMEVLASSLRAVLVANASDAVRDEALRRATQHGNISTLYLASGGYRGMNGNYAAGILEGMVHYHPEIDGWLDCTSAGGSA